MKTFEISYVFRRSGEPLDLNTLDFAAKGFWGGTQEKHSLMSESSIPMPHQTVASHSHPATESTSSRRNECMNKDAVVSATGCLAKEATIFYKRLASMLASKWDTPYSSTLCSLRFRLSFSLLRSATKHAQWHWLRCFICRYIACALA